MALNNARVDQIVKLLARRLNRGVVAQRQKVILKSLPNLVIGAEARATKAERTRLAAETVDSRLADLALRVIGRPVIRGAWMALPQAQRRSPPLRPSRRLLVAASRMAAESVNQDLADVAAVNVWVKKGVPVATTPTYEAEQKGLPAGFDVAVFAAAVDAQLTELNFPSKTYPAFHATTVGKVLLQGIYDTTRSDFTYAVRRAYEEGIDGTRGSPAGGSVLIKNYKTYSDVANDISDIRSGKPVRYQELASVADYVVSGADSWPVDDPTTRTTQVQIGLTRYVEGTAETGFSDLVLPPIVSEDASQQEIEPPNCEAVAFLAAAAEIEQTGAFDAVDAMLGRFLDGLIPVRDDAGGRSLDRYHWDSEDRLDPAARAQQYARVVGYSAGGDTSRDVQPNSGFRENLARLASSFARYDSDMRIANVISLDRQESSSASEYVRKSAHDLLANASLYGWGYTIFAARRIKRHIDQVFDVLGQESLQRAYGVTGPWQLVERVMAVETGTTPNVVAHRTMAKATKDLIEILTRYAKALSVGGASSRFLPSASDIALGAQASRSVVSIADYDLLVSASNSLLAVQGVGEEEVYRMAQPTRSPLSPSIPTVGGGFGSMIDSQGSQSALDQISQLVAQGQAPTLEQLQRLLPVAGVSG